MAFDPLALENLGDSIARAIGQAPSSPLSALPQFEGAGIYALYYTGDHAAYAPLTSVNRELEDPHPIYVGRAAAKGSRKGTTTADSGTALRSRIAQHARSIESASNLRIEDFSARWLVLEEVWVNLGESVLIRRHTPVWNALVDGFGNHDPGAGRRQGVRSRWDVLHPGRPWAAVLAPSSESASAIEQDVAQYLSARLH